MSDDTTIDVLERPRQHRENRKKNIGRKVADNQAQAVAKFLRVPPRKARLVLDAVRGRYASEALAFLRFIPNRAAQYISKVLTSAVANAANNHGLNPQNLKLVEARVDEGPRMKRVQPRAQGRAYRILKRMCHITVIVEEVEARPRKPKKLAGRRDQPLRRTAVATAATLIPASVIEEPVAPVPADTEVQEQTAPPAEITEQATTEAGSAPAVTGTELEASAESAPAMPAEPVTESAAPEVETETNAESAPAEPTEITAETAPETANAEDKTDEIGAPIE